MNQVPHWQWLMFGYFILVAVPAYTAHILLKTRTLANRTALNLLIYFAAIIGVAFLMHTLTMWLYFTFLF